MGCVQTTSNVTGLLQFLHGMYILPTAYKFHENVRSYQFKRQENLIKVMELAFTYG